MATNDFERDWRDGVEVNVGNVDGYQTISSTREAALFLIEAWPSRRGVAYARALKACLDVIAEDETEDVARAAFIAAVEEAQISVRRH